MNTSVLSTMGVEASQFEDTLKAGDLDWSPLADKVAGLDTGVEMPRKTLLYRSDTKAPLGIVGDHYSATTPREFLRSQYEFAEFVKGRVARAGFIGDRSRAFALIEIEKINLPREIRQKGDPVSVFIYSTDGWDGGTPQKSRLYLERLSCANGMTSRVISSSLWNSHTKDREERYERKWKVFLNEVQKTAGEIREEFITLAKTRMTGEQMQDFLKTLLPGESTLTEKKRGSMLNLFSAGEGNEGASRWDALNAVTEYVTHHRTYRDTDVSDRAVNRFLGVLETDTLRDRAMELLLVSRN